MNDNERKILEEIDTDLGAQENDIFRSVPVSRSVPPAAPNNHKDSTVARAVADASEETEGKALYDSAKESLSEWEVAINIHVKALANLEAGDRHEAVYEALRDVVFFAIWAMDNQEEAVVFLSFL